MADICGKGSYVYKSLLWCRTSVKIASPRCLHSVIFVSVGIDIRKNITRARVAFLAAYGWHTP